MKVPVLALGWLVVACSTPHDSTEGADDGSAAEATTQESGVVALDARVASEGAACTCAAAGACDSLGCPPDYSGPAFAAWCATVQAAAAGHEVAMRTCGSLLMITYGTDGGCDRGYAVEQSGGTVVATLGECNATVLGCASLEPGACLPACCLDKSCTLGIESLCPAWQADASTTGDAATE